VLQTSILKGFNTRLVGRNILYYPSLPSTVDVAKKMAKEGVCEGTVVLAGQQTAGRGRLGRTWLSSPGSSILMSVVLRPELAQLPRLNMMVGLAVVHSIEKVTGLRPEIKWPNDILINGKKVSGILVENTFDGRNLQASIASVGLNVRLDVPSFSEISALATSLSGELGRDLSPWDVLPSLIKAIDRLYGELQGGGPIYERWLARVETLGKVVQVKSGDSLEEGYAESIGPDGSIVLRRSNGSLVTVVTGE